MKQTAVKNKIQAKYDIPNDWTVIQLGDLGTFSKGKGILKEQITLEGLPCIRYGEIYTTHDFIIKEFKSFICNDVANESKEIKQGDILFAGSGESLEEIGKAVAYIGKNKAYAGGDVIILSTKKDVNPECLSYALETDFVKKQKRVLGQGNSVVHIYPSDLSKVKIPLPPFPEQKAIAQVLSTTDAAIHTTEKLIAQKVLRKKWLMQQLLTGKMRLKGFEGEWKEVRLKDVTTNFSRRNKDLVDAKVYSVTNKSGFVLQSDHFEGKVAGEDLSNYKIIKKNEFAYNPARVNVGSLAYFEEEIGIISSLYVCFKTTKDVLDYFLLQFLQFDHTKHRIEALGEGGVRVYLWYDLFSKIKIKIPSTEEQTVIAQVLQAADKEISLLKTKAEKLRENKKGLMQQLLTGKIRITKN